MSERSGEITKIRDLLRHGGKGSSVLLVSPPLKTGEMHALLMDSERLDEESELTAKQKATIRALRETGAMPSVSIVSENAKIDETEGTLLVYERQDGDSTVAVMANLGKAISGLREQHDFTISTYPGIET
ncbi:MAG TPA: hypothetical protein VFW77_04980 [Candidatus Saccharimonadales bacterium]|nr:hypothetical protein [Candidatus Saccharimonadales bacterium]